MRHGKLNLTLVWNNAKQKVAKQKYTPTKNTFKEKVKIVMTEIQKMPTLIKPFFMNLMYFMLC